MIWRGRFVALLAALPLNYLLVLPHAIDELLSIDCPDVVISSDRQTGCVGRKSCQTPVLIFFDDQLSLILLLLIIGVEEEIIF